MSNLQERLEIQSALERAWEDENYKAIYTLEQKLEQLEREDNEESSSTKS